jgi:hypothetical protein
LLYGSEAWVLTKRAEHQLIVFDRKLLLKISGPKRENGVYRMRGIRRSYQRREDE